MLTRSLFAAAAMLFSTAAAAEPAPDAPATCDSRTEKPMNLLQLASPIPAGQAVAYLMEFDKASPLWERVRQAPAREIGAVLNKNAPLGLNFDPDSALRLSEEHFDVLPLVLVHVCQSEGTMNVLETLHKLKAMNGISNVAPDSTLEEIPVMPSPPVYQGPQP